MYLLGLTGGIASGKSTVAGFFKDAGAVIVDADAIVHDLQQAGTPQTVTIVAKLGKHVLAADGSLNRAALTKEIFADNSVLDFLEDVLHPAVRHEEEKQIEQAVAKGVKLVVLDIPLLFETGADKICDGVAVCDIPTELRKQRAFERPNMSEEKWQAIASRRWGEDKIRQGAGFLIQTDTTLEQTEQQVKDLYTKLSQQNGSAWPKLWRSA